ncbi:MAG: hypothetical protein A3I78_11360 [Gammaproteobacteria bacterium RIFCSPLOWO2_02_FULL_56_15]|nr:MAG: hypothetical protein A3I78_11360 [Gammaproteobacteria bacterium RIFCSPLOWO2_02_FULL_56_15]
MIFILIIFQVLQVYVKEKIFLFIKLIGKIDGLGITQLNRDCKSNCVTAHRDLLLMNEEKHYEQNEKQPRVAITCGIHSQSNQN